MKASNTPKPCLSPPTSPIPSLLPKILHTGWADTEICESHTVAAPATTPAPVLNNPRLSTLFAVPATVDHQSDRQPPELVFSNSSVRAPRHFSHPVRSTLQIYPQRAFPCVPCAQYPYGYASTPVATSLVSAYAQPQEPLRYFMGRDLGRWTAVVAAKRAQIGKLEFRGRNERMRRARQVKLGERLRVLRQELREVEGKRDEM